MAYTRHEWSCGETITADLLNNLEGGVEEALECCESSSGGSDAPTITQYTESSGSREATYITEDDANKIFDEFPMGFKLVKETNGVKDEYIDAYVLVQEWGQGAAYLCFPDKAMQLVKEEAIAFMSIEGEISAELTWDSETRRYFNVFS